MPSTVLPSTVTSTVAPVGGEVEHVGEVNRHRGDGEPARGASPRLRSTAAPSIPVTGLPGGGPEPDGDSDGLVVVEQERRHRRSTLVVSGIEPFPASVPPG
jgi:hypothetical protein